nr:MAG TPA: hypothetical protein [Caudoviricetes sp.]
MIATHIPFSYELLHVSMQKRLDHPPYSVTKYGYVSRFHLMDLL